MSEFLELDEEKHDLVKKVAELQNKLEKFENYNKELTPIKAMARSEIIKIFENFLQQIHEESKFNDIFVIDKILTFAYDLENILINENKGKLPRF